MVVPQGPKKKTESVRGEVAVSGVSAVYRNVYIFRRIS